MENKHVYNCIGINVYIVVTSSYKHFSLNRIRYILVLYKQHFGKPNVTSKDQNPSYPGQDTAENCYQPKWQTDFEFYPPSKLSYQPTLKMY